ncbi:MULTISPECIES: EAL domain-containing protein [unclassified Rhizobium]|uniref:putative bifunctional diguanylate cyclase/phosphodiesterase n=1 Tax=unclassified Rhizobium TaxID=2613769 RepID=UPI000715D6AE|nr:MULTISPECIES: EAL domain-containing protein [unclassified Rhizobium]KQS93958.1 diguanylate cyclase [Rhizobium sp. Leaf391]KQT06832.1 diguanylate cyclase [Rhizobium sp. Leaf386]
MTNRADIDQRAAMTIDGAAHSTQSANDTTIAVSFARATNLALISIDGTGSIRFVNPSAAKLFGYERAEMIGCPVTIIIPERMRGAHTGGFNRVAGGQKPSLGGKTVEVSAIKKDGTEFPIEITLSVWRDENGMGAGAIIKDISERRERDSKLLRMANQDTLTGLPNRHRFIDLIRDELQAERPLTVVMLDLDGFKDVNDTHGHSAGDCVLQAVAVRLPYLLRGDAQVARFGGDEFAILLPNVGDPIAAQSEAKAIVDAFATPFDVAGHVLDLGASVGFAIAPAHGSDEEELIACADYALYKAKASGGRACRMFDHSMKSETLTRRLMRDELLHALRNGQLELYYQPQINLEDGRVFGVEALIRWNHPVRGLLLPGAFLPALDQSALALEIGWWTLDQASSEAARLSAIGRPDIKVGVNLFPAQLRAPNLCEKVAGSINRHGISANALELEVTETIALHDNDKSLEVLTALRQTGVGIAFDDFGTGFASLSSLQRYPLTTLKIDRSFIANIINRPGDAAITKALIIMSKELGLDTIAEGVETEEQEQALRLLGCPSAQGYLYGRPVPAANLEQMLVAQPLAKLANM